MSTQHQRPTEPTQQFKPRTLRDQQQAEASQAFTEHEVNQYCDYLLSQHPEYSPFFCVDDVNTDDKSLPICTALVRQSTSEQMQNCVVPFYLDAIARFVTKRQLVLPRQWLFYDNGSGTHFERPGMMAIRYDLVRNNRVKAVVFPALDRAARSEVNQSIFEEECERRKVDYFYADITDALQGASDEAKMFRRMMAMFNARQAKVIATTTMRGRLAVVSNGNVYIGRRPMGMEFWTDPEGKRKYRLIGLRDSVVQPIPISRMVREQEIADYMREDSEGYYLMLIYYWSARHKWSCHRIAQELNDRSIPTLTVLRARQEGKQLRQVPQGWGGKTVNDILRNSVYSGTKAYNAYQLAENPKRLQGRDIDITLKRQRTVRRPKAEQDHRTFTVDRAVEQEIWDAAQRTIEAGAHNKGSTAIKHEALMRDYVVCPVCLGKMRFTGQFGARRQDGTRTAYNYYRCGSHTRAKVPGMIAPTCPNGQNINADRVHERTKAQIRQVLAEPGRLLHHMQALLSTRSDDIDEADKRIASWRRKVAEHESALDQLAIMRARRQIDEDRYQRLAITEQQALTTDRQALAEMEAALAQVDAKREAIAEVAQILAQSADLTVDRDEDVHRWMDLLDIRYLPTLDTSGNGTLIINFTYFAEAVAEQKRQAAEASINLSTDDTIVGTIHCALGQSYAICGGKNESAIHWDMITDMRQGRITVDGETLYENGAFVI